jgi:hypothetical protein
LILIVHLAMPQLRGDDFATLFAPPNLMWQLRGIWAETESPTAQAGVDDVSKLQPADEERWLQAARGADQVSVSCQLLLALEITATDSGYRWNPDAELICARLCQAFTRFEAELDNADKEHSDRATGQSETLQTAHASLTSHPTSERLKQKLDSTAIHTPQQAQRRDSDEAANATPESLSLFRTRKRPLPPIFQDGGHHQRSYLLPSGGSSSLRRQDAHDRYDGLCAAVGDEPCRGGMGVVGGGGPFALDYSWEGEFPFPPVYSDAMKDDAVLESMRLPEILLSPESAEGRASSI